MILTNHKIPSSGVIPSQDTLTIIAQELLRISLSNEDIIKANIPDGHKQILTSLSENKNEFYTTLFAAIYLITTSGIEEAVKKMKKLISSITKGITEKEFKEIADEIIAIAQNIANEQQSSVLKLTGGSNFPQSVTRYLSTITREEAVKFTQILYQIFLMITATFLYNATYNTVDNIVNTRSEDYTNLLRSVYFFYISFLMVIKMNMAIDENSEFIAYLKACAIVILTTVIAAASRNGGSKNILKGFRKSRKIKKNKRRKTGRM